MMNNKNHNRRKYVPRKARTSPLIHLFFIIFAAICLIPFMSVISASLSSEIDLSYNGYSVLPRKIDLTAYKYIFKNPEGVLNAYKVTFFVTVTSTFLGVLFNSMGAFCLARFKNRLKGMLKFYIYFPTLFGGGLTASYIVNTRYLHLTDNMAVLILPALSAPMYIFMMRTFIQQLPASLFEAAKMDGASEYALYVRVALPLSKPSLASVAFMSAMGHWNSWYNSMLYIRDDDKITLQHMLQRIMMNLQALLQQMERAPMDVDMNDLPGENLRMAMLVVAIGPMMFLFPFFQKYFTKGMTVGAVKG